MEDKKNDYTLKEEQIARFAKALGHPARVAILHFLAKREACYFGAIHEELPIAKATVSQHLKELKEGRPIRCPVYSYVEHNRTEETREILPTKVIIVEGILIFQNPTLRDMFDIKIFVETDADVRILRRALRDVEERGRSMQSVVEQYLATVKPMHEQFVEPTRKFADIIVLEGGHNLVALDMIMQRIANHIAEN